MFFRRKRTRDTDPAPPWLKWLLIGFVALAVIGNMRQGKVHEAFQKAGSELNPKHMVQFEQYKNKIFPSYNGALRVRDTEEGSGAPAVCGQEAGIAYETFISEGKPIDDRATKDKPLTFRIGEGKAMPALEQGVVGMKLGGRRSLFAPYSMTYGIKAFARDDVPDGSMVRFEVELLSLRPKLPSPDASAYRIFTVQGAAGAPFLCGEPAKVHVTLWSVAGKKLFSTRDKEPLTFTPGRSDVFLGLEQAVVGMPRGGMRTAIVPPEFQKTMTGSAPKVDFPLPKEQTVLVDIEALP